MNDQIQAVLDKIEPKGKALPYLELDSMMLSQVVEIACRVSQNDINSTHIQNWVRRKYLPHPEKKKYNREQIANILLINDLRNILPLDQISHLLGYINNDLLDTADDRISPSKLYRYYSEIFDNTRISWERTLQGVEQKVEDTLKDNNLQGEDGEKAKTALVILNLLAQANLYQQIAKQWLENIQAPEVPADSVGKED